MRYLKKYHLLGVKWVRDEENKKTHIEIYYNEKLIQKFEGWVVAYWIAN